jgi:alpha-D-ribose 1-methylphosphonate 5-triphosphate synthase subunit PhnI
MGYTSVANRGEAVRAATALLADDYRSGPLDTFETLQRCYPTIVDQVMAEAGVVEPRVCARAFAQAQGDVARAVSLVRAWSAMLPRRAHVRTKFDQWHVLRRITPAFAEPPGGQFLGASRDYEQRLLDFEDAAAPCDGQTKVFPFDGAAVPAHLPAAGDALEADGLLAFGERATPDDLTRAVASRTARGAFLQLLARAETGALTSLAYAGIRGHGQRQDPTLVELRTGVVEVRVQRPDTGGTFAVGSFVATMAQIALYAVHENGEADAAFTLGVGLTPGRLERRAIASAMLDAATARAGTDPGVARAPYDDREFIALAVDGQEASGFVEHLKLPHHVTFASDLERVRAARRDGPHG